MSRRTANRLGVAVTKRVFVHGTADVHEFPMRVCERGALERSIAIRHLGRDVVRSANVPLARIKHFEIYSCFPSAVQIACRELGISELYNGYSLTRIGGLPFHGGPGNNYALHGIVAMVEVLRRDPAEFGLVTANGGYAEYLFARTQRGHASEAFSIGATNNES
jgi:acetyl-CoA C-acetyltransferase